MDWLSGRGASGDLLLQKFRKESKKVGILGAMVRGEETGGELRGKGPLCGQCTDSRDFPGP